MIGPVKQGAPTDEETRAAGGNGTAPAVASGSLALVNSGLFADASNFDLRFVPDYERIDAIVGALRTLGFKVVLTSGSFDILHEGHSMYLEAARRFGDFLIVGLDSDEKIRARKGAHRPVGARDGAAAHGDPPARRGPGHAEDTWPTSGRLIKTIRPDVLVATADTYSQRRDLRA